jgi:hypothetical protein
MRLHEMREKVFSICRINWTDWDITEQRTRHTKLEILVGRAFWFLGRSTAQSLAEWQFERKSIQCDAGTAEHLKEFHDLWAGMVAGFIKELSSKASEAFESLLTEHERDVFRIIRSFARKASHNGENEFGFSVENVALRIGVTHQAISKMRYKFENASIIRKTRPHEINRQAARFMWLLEDDL